MTSEVEERRLSRRVSARSASRELFTVKNSDWVVKETAPGVFALTSADGVKTLSDMSGKQLVSILAVISELDRHLRAR
jgi:hypothetical protein